MPIMDICGQSVPDCVTIDRTQEETLNNARIAFPQASLHPTTKTAVIRLLPCLQAATGTRGAMIVGHGKQGEIITGTGKFEQNSNKFMRLSNIGIWQSDIRRLDLEGDITELVFCSCDTGGGNKGVQFLRAVADTISARASGFTGLLFISLNGTISCQDNGAWQHLDFGQPDPFPLETPSLFRAESLGVRMELKLKADGEYIIVPYSKVSAVSYYKPNAKEHARPALSIEREDVEKILRLINFSDPAELEGEPLAIVTGELEVKFTPDQKMKGRRFIVYNGRLLQDKTHREVFYYASLKLDEALTGES